MEDKAANLPQMVTRSGRSVGSGQLVDSGYSNDPG